MNYTDYIIHRNGNSATSNTAKSLDMFCSATSRASRRVA